MELDQAETLHEEKDNTVSVGAAPMASHLPTWVLRMREKIESSRSAHADAELRIGDLSKGVDCLTLQLSKMEMSKKLPLHTKIPKSQEHKPERKARPVKKYTSLFDLPSEVFSYTVEYLKIEQIFRLGMVCKALKEMVEESSIWARLIWQYCPHLVKADAISTRNSAIFMKAMQRYLQTVNLCVSFVQTMKDQRCVPKHKSVQPHRHLRHERQVTHPLPLFQHSQSFSEGGIIGRVAQSGTKDDLIMSHAETLSSDYRSVAHKALASLLHLTADMNDPAFFKLLNDGIVTVLSSLLSNEEGALQSVSCSILGNLLCWEARKKRDQMKMQSRARSSQQHSHPFFAESKGLIPTSQEIICLNALFGMTKMQVTQIVSVSEQFAACGGVKLLTALLTSPTAAINIAHSKADTSGTTHLRGTTSNIQGISTKEASRALITMLFPAMPIPLSTPAKKVADKRKNDKNIPVVLDDACCEQSVFRVGNSTPSTTPQKIILSPISPSDQLTVVPEHLRSPAISDLFLTDHSARPWLFSYFYKSGAVKDQFTTYLKFRPLRRSSLDSKGINTQAFGIGDGIHNSGSVGGGAELRGRGVDNIGTFKLTGRTEAEISGWSWYFQKSYVPVINDFNSNGNNNSDMFQDSIESSRIERWLRDVDGVLDPPSVAGSQRLAPVHVSHVGYWSCGREICSEDALSSASVSATGSGQAAGLDFIDEDSTGICIPRVPRCQFPHPNPALHQLFSHFLSTESKTTLTLQAQRLIPQQLKWGKRIEIMS